jgi:hypothetical protein
MAAWTEDELDRVGDAHELELASLRRDDTWGRPVTVWVVRDGDDLYVRSWRGRRSGWFCGVQQRHEGRIRAGGVEKGVAFEEVEVAVNDAIDAAYRTKYGRYSPTYVDPMVAPEARAATLRLVPS